MRGNIIKQFKYAFLISLLSLPLLISCTYNPLVGQNETTGSLLGGGLGTAGGVGVVSALGGTKPMMALGGIGGGMFGYYITTLRHDAAGIMQGGGKVYKVGQFIGIYLPTDRLFISNTAELSPHASATLDSVVTVLKRYPQNNVLVSGNTSGFYRSPWEQKLSERRAKVISAYLWQAGITEFKDQSNSLRRVTYVGHGDYFPIASNLRNDGIRANSRVQITSYPDECDLGINQNNMTFQNISSEDLHIEDYPVNRCADNTRLETGGNGAQENC